MIIGLIICVNQNSFAYTEHYVEYDATAPAGVDDVGCGDTEANSCRTVEYLIETEGIALGDRINVKYDGAADTQAGITTDINITTDGNAFGPIAIQGYGSSVGDGTIAVFDGESSATNIFNLVTADYWVFKDIEVKGSTGDAFQGGAGALRSSFENVTISSAGGLGIDSNGAYGQRVINCDITATSTALDSDGTDVYKSYFHDCAQGIYMDGGMVLYSILDTISGHGIYIDSDYFFILGNTLYNIGDDGIFIDINEVFLTIVDNIISEVTNEEIDNNGEIMFYGYNNLFTTGGATTAGGTIYHNLGGEQLDVDPQFEGPAGGDFNIGANLDDTGMPGQIGASTNTNEIGVLSYEETGAGAGGATGHGWFSY